MENQRQFKGVWIPKEIWLNKDLTQQEKIILIEIDSLEDEEKGCWASNKHFVELFGFTSSRVSQVIQNLQKKKYVNIEYDRNGKEIIARYIRINRPPYPKKWGMSKNDIGMSKNDMGVCQFPKGGYVNFLKENNTLSNNTILDNINNVELNSIIDYLNIKASKHFKYTDNNKKHIRARINEGFTLEDIKCVIDKKVKEWINNEKMNKYLRPETLFGNKFESYLNEKEKEYTTKDIAGIMDWSDF